MKGNRLTKQVKAFCDMTDEELDEYFRKRERREYMIDYFLLVLIAALVCWRLWSLN